MIRGNKNFVRGVPMRVAVGIKTVDDQIVVIGGPVQAIAAQTRLFLEVVQGTQKSGEIAKKIRQCFVRESWRRTETGCYICSIGGVPEFHSVRQRKTQIKTG
jgi:hypothetical protein